MIITWQFIVMLFLTALFLGWFIFRPIKRGLTDIDSNIAINKQKQEELTIDINQGLIDEEQFKVAESEIITTLANELKGINSESIAIKPLSWSIAIFLLIGIVSFAIYSQLSPKILPSEQSFSQPMTMNDSIQQLQNFLEENPDNFQALKMMGCLLYTSPSPRDATLSRMPSSA